MIQQAELERTPSFQATVQMREAGDVFAAYFKTADGKDICIGGPQASVEMIGFIKSLHKGQTCALPDEFVAFQKAQAGKK
jgi:hypothetical protein